MWKWLGCFLTTLWWKGHILEIIRGGIKQGHSFYLGKYDNKNYTNLKHFYIENNSILVSEETVGEARKNPLKKDEKRRYEKITDIKFKEISVFMRLGNRTGFEYPNISRYYWISNFDKIKYHISNFTQIIFYYLCEKITPALSAANKEYKRRCKVLEFLKNRNNRYFSARDLTFHFYPVYLFLNKSWEKETTELSLILEELKGVDAIKEGDLKKYAYNPQGFLNYKKNYIPLFPIYIPIITIIIPIVALIINFLSIIDKIWQNLFKVFYFFN